mmetsp:Transcript_24631/g.73937  ORF Transcript_24631/g.73937 Transcript_24631/m.73937 type:complete len:168 (+) Transcript_24631:124-627(+)
MRLVQCAALWSATLAAALRAPQPLRSAALRRSTLALRAAERVDFTLEGSTVRTAFFANQMRRECVQFRGIAGEISPGAGATVAVAAEGERKKLDSFVSWCQKGALDLALEGGAPRLVGEPAYSAPRGLSGFSCADELCDVEPEVAADYDDEISESDLVKGMIEELSK